MTGKRMTLILRASSTEGIEDMINVLETVIEDIKGGIESSADHSADDQKVTSLVWKITPEYGN